MTSRLTFDLDTVCQLAEHAAAATTGTDHSGTIDSGPALLLRSGSSGIWLTSNAPHPQPAPATQPGTLDRRAAFADQCPPGTPWLEQARLLRMLGDAEITTGPAFTMPTKIPANRAAGSVKCRPSSARCRERPVVGTSQWASRAPRGCS